MAFMSQYYIITMQFQTLPFVHAQSEFTFGQAGFPSRPTSQTPLLAETELQMLQDLMSEAMEETDGQHTPVPQQNGEDFVQ